MNQNLNFIMNILQQQNGAIASGSNSDKTIKQ